MSCSPVHVVVGVIEDEAERVLIAKRPEHLHQGGLWEFPGGKVHDGESVTQALQRELYEELYITLRSSSPLMCIQHDYGDKQVLLDVHRVGSFTGTATGREGQAIRWVLRDQLREYAFPAANRLILNTLLLPEFYMITPEYSGVEPYLALIEAALAQGISLIQLRARHMGEAAYRNLAMRALDAFSAHRDKIMLNTEPVQFIDTAGGLHLRSELLMQPVERPVGMHKLLGASVHDLVQVEHANQLCVDFMVIAPVLPTGSHPEATPLGWAGFERLARAAACPVYALGGMRREDLAIARQYGAHGIAGISAFTSG